LPRVSDQPGSVRVAICVFLCASNDDEKYISLHDGASGRFSLVVIAGHSRRCPQERVLRIKYVSSFNNHESCDYKGLEYEWILVFLEAVGVVALTARSNESPRSEFPGRGHPEIVQEISSLLKLHRSSFIFLIQTKMSDIRSQELK
jgi:hypothetical protein